MVETVLAKLPGKKATATMKGTPTTKVVLEMFGLLPYFDHVQGTDGFPAKPHPDVIFRALEALNADARDCLFVGDATSDADAAERAGVKFAAVTYGYGNRDELARYKPDYWLDNISQLLPGDLINAPAPSAALPAGSKLSSQTESSPAARA